MFNAWIVGLAGIWMIVAPFVPMTASGNMWNDFVTGFIAAVLGFSMVGEGWRQALAGIVGILLIGAGFVPALRMTSGMYTVDVVGGILLVIAGFAATRHHHLAIGDQPHAAH